MHIFHTFKIKTAKPLSNDQDWYLYSGIDYLEFHTNWWTSEWKRLCTTAAEHATIHQVTSMTW